MVDILHDFPIRATIDRVFRAVSTPKGLDTWWTESSDGSPEQGAEYELQFGPEHNWSAKVIKYVPNSEFVLEMTRADEDWEGTRIGLRLEKWGQITWVRFRHTGWPDENEHFRISCNCWAMYLRVLRRSLEYGEFVSYENRLEV